MVNCEQCGKSYGQKKDLYRHIRSVHEHVVHTCQQCLKTFSRLDDVRRHQKTCQGSWKRITQQEDGAPSKRCRKSQNGGSSEFLCEICRTTFNERKNLLRHQRNVHGSGKCTLGVCDPNVESALEQTVCQIDLSIEDKRESIDITLDQLRPDIKDYLLKFVGAKKGVKWQMIVKVRFTRPDTWFKDDVLDIETFFRSKTYVALHGSDIDGQITMAVGKILECMQQFVKEGSGWTFDSLLGVKLCVVTYEPLAASSFIPLPRELLLTKAIINVQNEDHKCFLWSVLASIHSAEKDPQRVSKYLEFEHELDTSGLDFPVPITQVKKFSQRNRLTINVYGYEKKMGVYPLLIDDNSGLRHIDLLLIANDEQQHYCLIRNMSRLLSHLTKHDGAMFYCQYCLHRFSRRDLLEDHIELCRDHEAQKVILPSEEDCTMRFRSFKKQLHVPFTVYADFESFAVKIEGPKPSSETSSSTTTTRHEPSGFCFVVIGPDGKFFQDPVIYRGENVVGVFFEKLLEVQVVVTAVLEDKKPMVLTEQDEENFQLATHCHICLKAFELCQLKVRDHDHLTGKYRGAAHRQCNLEFEVCDFIPVVFHNLKHYDSHLLMQGIGLIKDQES